MPILTDTHCHLYMQDFENDLDSVIKAAYSEGVRKILVPGIDLESSHRSVQLSELYPQYLFAAVGVHPNHSLDIGDSDFNSIKLLASHSNVVAIGEIGLDFYREKTLPNDQINTLRKMLSISKATDKPVCIHNRNADSKIIEILDSWYSDLVDSGSILADNPGVFHSFSGSTAISDWALTHNFYLGISGPVTFKNSQELVKKIENIDLAHFLVETDAPYLSPHPKRGKRNEPLNVNLVCKKIAEIKKISFNDVIKFTGENANALFRWSS